MCLSFVYRIGYQILMGFFSYFQVHQFVSRRLEQFLVCIVVLSFKFFSQLHLSSAYFIHNKMVKLFFDLQRRMMLFDLTSFHHLQNFGQCATGCFCSFLLNSLGTMNLEVEFHDALV